MHSHPFDAISAFFGTVFAALAVLVMASDEVIFDVDAAWFGPAIVVLLGLVLLLTGLRSGRRHSGAALQAPAAAEPVISAGEPGEIGVAAADDDADPATF